MAHKSSYIGSEIILNLSRFDYGSGTYNIS